MFVEEFFGLVDLGGQVRATATIGVVEQHELTVLLAHLVLVQFALTVNRSQVRITSEYASRFDPSNIRQLENQGGFTAGHAGFKSTVILLVTIAISLCNI